ncbi:MAG: methyltransferase domain-containing protein [Bacteroidetes bacterium]|nr:methyltransferase domain-containing protein [Bacteroidota bacterium]
MRRNLKWRLAQYTELHWWKNYLKDKSKESYLDWKRTYWKLLLEKIKTNLQLDSGRTVLDVGCGPAGIFIILNHLQVDAVDPLLDEYNNMNANFQKSDFPEVNFHAVPFEKYETHKKYDTVFCLNAINHVADLKLSINRLIHHTRVGGFLLVSIDAHNYRILKYLFTLIPGDILHPHQYLLKDYENLLTLNTESKNGNSNDNGLEIVERLLIKKQRIFNHHLVVIRKNKEIEITD